MSHDLFGGDDDASSHDSSDSWRDGAASSPLYAAVPAAAIPPPPVLQLLRRGLSGGQEEDEDEGGRGSAEESKAAAGGNDDTASAASPSASPRKADLHTMALRAAQNWRGGQLPEWATQVPVSDLEAARARIAASGDDKGGTALCDTIRDSNEDATKTLIAAGTNVQSTQYLRRGMKRAAIYAAAARGEAGIVEALAAAGADVDWMEAKCGFTPLHTASENGNGSSVSALIAADATIDTAATHTGATPLMVAAQSGRQGVVELLLKAGADRTATDKWGRTARQLSERRGMKKWGDAFWQQPGRRLQQQQQQQQQQDNDDDGDDGGKGFSEESKAAGGNDDTAPATSTLPRRTCKA